MLNLHGVRKNTKIKGLGFMCNLDLKRRLLEKEQLGKCPSITVNPIFTYSVPSFYSNIVAAGYT